eukprot:m.10097 g.10097  ORF g.10097 m.10097 type:complete len:54 (-) comp4200_c0_seq1:1284-1445(-)
MSPTTTTFLVFYRINYYNLNPFCCSTSSKNSATVLNAVAIKSFTMGPPLKWSW